MVRATHRFEQDFERPAREIHLPSDAGGKNLLGTGGVIFGGPGEVVLDDLRPDALLTHVTVTGLEDENGFAGEWVAGAHAICANP